MPLKSLIRTIPHYPQQGIMFRDITTLLKDATGFALMIDGLVARYQARGIAKIAAVESRGFIIGAALAYQLRAGFVPLRKPGKLPAERTGQDYALEYGSDRIEMHVDAVAPGERVLLVDDVIATGGTAEAAVKLLTAAQAAIEECCFVIELPVLGGRARLEALGQRVFALLDF